MKHLKPYYHFINESSESVQDMAKNPNTDPEKLRQIADLGNYDLLVALAKNPSTPSDILMDFIKNPNKHSMVGLTALGNPRLSPEELDELAKSTDRPNHWRKIAENPSASAETLAWLMSKNDESTDYNIAAHLNASPETLAELSNHSSYPVKANVAMNPNTPAEILIRLASMKEMGFSQDARENPSYPDDITDWALSDW
jgi:hypothetical protein